MDLFSKQHRKLCDLYGGDIHVKEVKSLGNTCELILRLVSERYTHTIRGSLVHIFI